MDFVFAPFCGCIRAPENTDFATEKCSENQERITSRLRGKAVVMLSRIPPYRKVIPILQSHFMLGTMSGAQ
jgi:hypothetical protein